MVPEIKYFGVSGLEELILLTKNAIAKKADKMQFGTMPDPIKYIGRVVQYVGESDATYTRSHFYYSNGVKWVEENVSDSQTTPIEMVTSLPSWEDADRHVLYILKNANGTMGLYVKNPYIENAWYIAESSGSFAIVNTLPRWGKADSNTIYFKPDGTRLVGYIKKDSTTGAWYTVGEESKIVVDSILSDTSVNPVQNKVIYAALQDILAQVSSIYHYKGACTPAELPGNAEVGDVWNLTEESEYGPISTNVAWDGTKWDALGGDLSLDEIPTAGSKHAVMSGGVYDALTAKPTCRKANGVILKNQHIIELTREEFNDLAIKDPNTYYMITDDSGEGIPKDIADQLAQKEDKANKVTFIDNTATHEQYPSAKAVYDSLDSMQSDILTTFNVHNDMLLDQLAKKESKENKITILDNSVTNNEYPSARAVYDFVKAEVDKFSAPDWGNMETVTNHTMYATTNGYVVPSDGVFICSGLATSEGINSPKEITINGITVALGIRTSTYLSCGNVCCPVKQGDKIRTDMASTFSLQKCSFVPYK